MFSPAKEPFQTKSLKIKRRITRLWRLLTEHGNLVE